MEMLNKYGRELTQKEIDTKYYRDFVGGMWDEMGELQFEFLLREGLKPNHYLLDVGCGALRGGIHFIRYLDDTHYYGIDSNTSLIESGKRESEENGLLEKHPQLLVNNKFEVSKFNMSFDYAIAQSVFTHLPINHIIRCLSEMSKVMKAEGVFFATFFEAPTSAYLEQFTHQKGGIITNYDQDPFHYSFKEFEWMSKLAGMNVKLIGDWKHPRCQKMIAFSVKSK